MFFAAISLNEACFNCHRAIVANISSTSRQTRTFRTSTLCNGKPVGQTASGLPRPRLDYKNIAENTLYKSHNAFNRKSPIPIGAVQSVARLYEEHKQLSSDLNLKVHVRNLTGDKIRDASGPAKEVTKREAKELKTQISDLEKRLLEVDEKLFSLALSIPNDTHERSPVGPEEAAVTLATYGPEPLPADPARDHVAIGKALGLLDLEAAATVTGSSWYYLLNEGALLEFALTQYALRKALARGFKATITPDVIRSDVATRCGFQPRDQGDDLVQQMYHLQRATPTQPELVLSGTAEIPLAGLFANKIFECGDLPLKKVGLGRAFRSEAGARGADTRGLYRVHQFSKLELFAVTTEEKSEAMMQEMLDLQVDIFSSLGLTLRVLDMPTEELGASAYRKYDIEAWMPGRGNWGEISSTSNCTDYQSRRLHIRYRKAQNASAITDLSNGSPSLPFAHTLNGTAAAIPRLIVALLENGAIFDDGGKVVGLALPSSLRPFWPEGSSTTCVQWI